jgi:putative ABC transport system permease protein
MRLFALKMLFGDVAKFYGILFGLIFATLLICQQASIFTGLMSRTFGFIRDTPQPDLWVVDPAQLFVDDQKPLRATEAERVRSVSGVAWAVPLFKSLLSTQLPDGTRQTCDIIGIDDATLIAGPPRMVAGRVEDLRRPDTVIINTGELGRKMKAPASLPVGQSRAEPLRPGEPTRPLEVGDVLELNERRAEIVGICETTQTFQSAPVLYTTFSRAREFAPANRRIASMVLVKAMDGVDHAELAARIKAETGLDAYVPREYAWKTIWYWVRQTGIPINFGIAIGLGFLVGVAIAGQMFYNFTLENLRYFGAMKAMGLSTPRLLGMVSLQALTAGFLGVGIGLGAVAAFGLNASGGKLAFLLVWQVAAATGVAVMLICIGTAMISMIPVARLDPADVFRS